MALGLSLTLSFDPPPLRCSSPTAAAPGRDGHGAAAGMGTRRRNGHLALDTCKAKTWLLLR